MARPKRCRRIGSTPGSSYFKPRGIPLSALEEVVLSFDEFEAVRLADLEGLYQDQAAEKMGISRQTFGRIIEAAHHKVAEALVRGKALKIEGGAIEIACMKMFKCHDCRHSWELPDETGGQEKCPSCSSGNIQAAQKGRGHQSGHGTDRGRCCREKHQTEPRRNHMKVGFAVEANEGIESKVYNHFGSAPLFIIVDAATKEITTVNNKDLHHVHGACNPIKALDGQSVDGMVVGGIGAGALSKLNAMGIKVYGSAAVTVKENLSLLNASKLQELFPINACRGHEGGCGH